MEFLDEIVPWAYFKLFNLFQEKNKQVLWRTEFIAWKFLEKGEL